MTNREWIKYASKCVSHKGVEFFSHPESSIRMTKLWDSRSPIVKVRVTIHDVQTREHSLPDKSDPVYWGWLLAIDYGGMKGDMVMIQPSYNQFEMQFTYGHEAEEERGRGKAYRLNIVEIERVE